MTNADRYVQRIRNNGKALYARHYLAWLRGQGPKPEASNGYCSLMARQAVEWNLDDLVKSERTIVFQ